MSAITSSSYRQPDPITAPDLSEQKQNEQLFRTLIEEAFNKGNLDILDDLVSDDLVEHQFVGPNHPRGVEGARAIVRDCRSLLGDFTLTIQDLVATGDTVWARMIGEGIHQREFFGFPPTGKRTRVDVVDICRFKDGKMVEHWGIPDRFHLLIQIGAWPPRPAASH
jgi:predicted ester cyclase